MLIETVSDFRAAIRAGAWVWPGGYPKYFITADGGALCFEAAKEERRLIVDAIARNSNEGGWRVIAVEINWEDPELVCDHSGELIDLLVDRLTGGCAAPAH